MSQALLDAVAAVAVKVDAVSADVQAEKAQVDAALAALQQPDPDIATAITSLTGVSAGLDALDSAVKGIIPDVPAEPPAPEPEA